MKYLKKISLFVMIFAAMFLVTGCGKEEKITVENTKVDSIENSKNFAESVEEKHEIVNPIIDVIHKELNLVSNDVIFNANSIYFADLADNGAEGLHFWRSSTTVDTLWAKNGSLYFTPNRTMGSTNTNYILLHSGNSKSCPSGYLQHDTGKPLYSGHNHYLEYFSGQPTLGTADGNCYAGSSNNGKLWSYPPEGTYSNGTQSNVQILRMSWSPDNYWNEIFTSPNYNRIYFRAVSGGVAGNWRQFWLAGDTVTGAVWNDYAEYRESSTTKPGLVLKEKGDDTLIPTEERLSHFCGVSSDTYGFSQGETDKAKTPIAVAGRVLVYTFESRDTFEPGDCVCAGPGGTVSKMTRQEIIEWPDRIVGKVSCVPDYEIWGGGEGADRESVKVDGRIWIQVK